MADVITRIKGELPKLCQWLDSDVLKYNWDRTLVLVTYGTKRIWLPIRDVRVCFDSAERMDRLCAPGSEIAKSLRIKEYHSSDAG